MKQTIKVGVLCATAVLLLGVSGSAGAVTSNSVDAASRSVAGYLHSHVKRGAASKAEHLRFGWMEIEAARAWVRMPL